MQPSPGAGSSPIAIFGGIVARRRRERRSCAASRRPPRSSRSRSWSRSSPGRSPCTTPRRPAAGAVALVPRHGRDVGRRRSPSRAGSPRSTCCWRPVDLRPHPAHALGRRGRAARVPRSTRSYSVILGGAVLILITLLAAGVRRRRHGAEHGASPVLARHPRARDRARARAGRRDRARQRADDASSRRRAPTRPTSGRSPRRWPGTRCRT